VSPQELQAGSLNGKRRRTHDEGTSVSLKFYRTGLQGEVNEYEKFLEGNVTDY